MIVAIIIICFGTTFARYVYNAINNYILESKGFYFTSSVLHMNNKNYKINNWDGVNHYILTIDVLSKKNSLKSTTSDIEYETEVICPSEVTCKLSKTKGIIYQTAKVDSYQITITPTGNFYAGDEIQITTKATATFPYRKTLSATYTIGVEKNKFSYTITDSKNAKYATLDLTNAVTYYQVERAFGNHKVGDQISVEDYNLLSAQEQENCFSAKVTISFPPEQIYLDVTATPYKNRLENSQKLKTVNGYSYISGFAFKIPASSSEKIIFYKEDITKDYTYPVVNNTSVINVSAETAQ